MVQASSPDNSIRVRTVFFLYTQFSSPPNAPFQIANDRQSATKVSKYCCWDGKRMIWMLNGRLRILRKSSTDITGSKQNFGWYLPRIPIWNSWSRRRALSKLMRVLILYSLSIMVGMLQLIARGSLPGLGRCQWSTTCSRMPQLSPIVKLTGISKRDVNYASLEWSAIQTLFEKAKSDVLLLLDCCSAASAAPLAGRAITETIAACGWESIAPEPGRFSFTDTLIKVLEEWINRPFTAAMLHSEIPQNISKRSHEMTETLKRSEERRVGKEW